MCSETALERLPTVKSLTCKGQVKQTTMLACLGIALTIILSLTVVLVYATRPAPSNFASTFSTTNTSVPDISFSYTVSDSAHLVLVGDWGGQEESPHVTPAQRAIASSVDSLACHLTADLNTRLTGVMGLGDNFYESGVKSSDDPRFQSTFERVFDGECMRETPWFVMSGNHDWTSSVSAQIRYKSPRWVYPDYMYAVKFTTTADEQLVDLVVIDTQILCDKVRDFYHKSDPADPDYQQQDLAEKYWSWLEDTLAASTARYLLVSGHYPVYSGGVHGNTQCLQDRLLPMLYRYRVTAYITAHDHSVQHFIITDEPTCTNWTVHHILSGMGAKPRPTEKMDAIRRERRGEFPKGSLKFFYSPPEGPGAYVYLSLPAAPHQRPVINYIDANKNQVLHTAEITSNRLGNPRKLQSAQQCSGGLQCHMSLMVVVVVVMLTLGW